MVRTVDLTRLGDEFVIHYGAEYHRVNAYTFANSLVALADAIRNANAIVNPGYEIEIVVESLAPGSFRARIKTFKKSLGNIFSPTDAKNVVLAIIASQIFQCSLAPDAVQIHIHDDSVIIEDKDTRIIIPRQTYELGREVEKSEVVKKNIQDTFHVLERDQAITDFGLTPRPDDTEPLLSIPRTSFPIISGGGLPQATRDSIQEETLEIVRAILERSNRLWQFVWRGIKISAPVLDRGFYDQFFAHRITIAPGDSLKVKLKITQVLDESTGIYTNQSYEVLQVLEHIPRIRQHGL